MINRIYSSSALNISPAMNSGTVPAEAPDSFSAVYNRMQELRTAAASRPAACMADREKSAREYAIYAPGVGGDYVPRVVEFTDEEAQARVEKLQQVKTDIEQKIQEGFFIWKDNRETFAYLYETYAEAFGPDFMDYEWLNYAMSRPPTTSDLAKSEVQRAFQSQFYDVKRSFGGDDFRDGFAAYFGYGDMTKEERYRAILSDFAASGELNYAGHFKMFWLLDKTGAVDADLIEDANDVLHDKLLWERSRYYMTEEDIIKARYAYGYYGYDMAAELLNILDHIDLRNRQTVYRDPSVEDGFTRQDVREFFKKLNADLGGLRDTMKGL